MSTGLELRERSMRTSPRNVALLVCCVGGLGVSIYLTLTHYTKAVSLVCSNNGAINCEKVTTSPQSVVFGIPVAVLGLIFFVSMLVLSLPRIYQRPELGIARLRLASSVVGIGFVFYLLYNELFVIHAICLWCSSVHILTFIIFCLVVTGWSEVVGYDGEESPYAS
jgi:uncharacterized membrane protein